MCDEIVVGRIYKSKRWGEFEVISRKHGAGTQVRFLNTGNIENTNAKEILSGKVCDRKTLNEELYKVGDIVPTNHWGDVEILEATKQTSLTVKFLNTGNIKDYVRGSELRTGKCRDAQAWHDGVKPLNFVSPQHVAAFMHPGETYASNSWGDVEVLEYKSSTEVLIKFLNSGNTFVASRDNILKGLIKDAELSKALTRERHEAERQSRAETRKRAEALVREIRKVEDEELAARKAESEKSALSRSRWYKIVREVRCHTDSDGSLLCGKRLVDRNGFTFQVRAKRAFDRSTWFVVYDKSRNGYWFSEAAIKSGDIVDKCSDEVIEAERMRLKLVNAAKYEADRERRIAMACAYQKNNVEKTRVRNRNRLARRKGAVGTHTVEETQALLLEQNYRCACCGIDLDETRHLDHKMPLKLGGTNYINNLQWMCAFCNGSKNATHPDEWAVYSASDAFKRRRLERLSTEREDWKLIVQSMPLLYEFSLCCDSDGEQST